MRKLIIASLAIAALFPTTAMAQPGHNDRVVTRVVTVDRRPAPVAVRRPVVETRVIVGGRLDKVYFSGNHVIGNPGRYQLPRPTARQRWVRVRNDAVLVNVRTGRVVTVRNRFFR